MRDMEHMVLAAQKDRMAADMLIEQYLPFIKSEASKLIGRYPTYDDDELSIAMFAFYEALMAYKKGRGAFLSFASVAIRRRIIDYSRKQMRHKGMLSLDMPKVDGDTRSIGEQLEDKENHIELHRTREDTNEEIAHFALQLREFDLDLSDIAENCPKQERTFAACMKVMDYAKTHGEITEQLLQNKKLPISYISKVTSVDKKTLERHRKYLVAVLLALTNGFEIIRGHLQMLKRKEKTSL